MRAGATYEIGIASIGSTEDNGAIFNFSVLDDVGGAEDFLFLASFSVALVFFTYDAEGR